MSELLTAVIQYNKCYYDTYYNHNHLYYLNCMLAISCKSSTIFSSSDILIVNNGGNVVLIGFALADGMPELLMLVVYITVT